MPRINRIIRPSLDDITHVGSVQAIERAVRSGEPSRMAREMRIRAGSGTTEKRHHKTSPDSRFVASASKVGRPTA
jgi:hypothetical protein